MTVLGGAVSLPDNLDELRDLLDEGVVDFVQCMGIAHIGFQGEPFDEQVLETIQELRQSYPEMDISIDGGVSVENLVDLQEAGANRFVSGSGIFDHGIPQENIEQFYEILES